MLRPPLMVWEYVQTSRLRHGEHATAQPLVACVLTGHQLRVGPPHISLKPIQETIYAQMGIKRVHIMDQGCQVPLQRC